MWLARAGERLLPNVCAMGFPENTFNIVSWGKRGVEENDELGSAISASRSIWGLLGVTIPAEVAGGA